MKTFKALIPASIPVLIEARNLKEAIGKAKKLEGFPFKTNLVHSSLTEDTKVTGEIGKIVYDGSNLYEVAA